LEKIIGGLRRRHLSLGSNDRRVALDFSFAPGMIGLGVDEANPLLNNHP